MKADAYSVFQTFPAAPRSEFTFERHYLLYCASGALRLEAEGRVWALPPARAAFITAGKPIYVTLPRPVVACSVLFDPAYLAQPAATLTIVNMSPLARELVLACSKWTDPNGALDTYGHQLFSTLAAVISKLAETPSRSSMPAPKSRGLIHAMALTEERMANAPDFETLARDVAMTPRSLARRFEDEMGMTWRQALRRLRMIRALELLADPVASITQTAFAVGYSSLSAFNAAFLDFTGETPSSYRFGLCHPQLHPANLGH
ncbi:AraC family transcriptional regulator [Phyllobacterium meliloti]|uniref:AraC family transcriptional regulator n=1 Tax=Phyllobacterium meliloti TaxID=555317 RepID=UPI001D15DA2F|nr:AraC family transcriptional regulator [Phyllobacterium sp. T1293]UGX89303.1 AraC family transcriptional regulator [Phyllobacterium sp. T1293]